MWKVKLQYQKEQLDITNQVSYMLHICGVSVGAIRARQRALDLGSFPISSLWPDPKKNSLTCTAVTRVARLTR
jgi:hypothetical protein